MRDEKKSHTPAFKFLLCSHLSPLSYLISISPCPTPKKKNYSSSSLQWSNVSLVLVLEVAGITSQSSKTKNEDC